MKFKLMIILAIFLLSFSTSCSSGQQNIKTDDNRSYEIIHIDGMTCIKYNGSQRVALTCNLAEWNGNTGKINND